MIKIPSEMQLHQMQEIEEENIAEPDEGERDEQDLSDARFRLALIRSAQILREIKPLFAVLEEWIGNEPVYDETLNKVQTAHQRISELLEGVELEAE